MVMHNYLRAVGFSNLMNRTDFDHMINQILESSLDKQIIALEQDVSFAEINWEAAPNMGICMRGEFDQKGKFYLEHYFPYYKGSVISTNDDVMINKRVDTDAYTGMCDDYRLGVSLIFYLQNAIEYMKECDKNKTKMFNCPIKLAALSVEGKVILPIDHSEITIRHKTLDAKHRNKLIAEAKKGNQEAIDSLTIDDIDLYAMVSRRVKYEDIYSIVETSFVPYGSESDSYTIIGEIAHSKLVTNHVTNEEVYELSIACNDLEFDLCINKSDLMGEPAIGRRFKGNIWLQGRIEFSS